MKHFIWWKCLNCLDWNGFFGCLECGHNRWIKWTNLGFILKCERVVVVVVFWVLKFVIEVWVCVVNLDSWYVYCGIPSIWGVEMVASEWGDLQPWNFEEDDALIYMPRTTTIVILQITLIWFAINGLQGDVHLNCGEVKLWYVHLCRKGNFFDTMFLISKNIVSTMNMD